MVVLRRTRRLEASLRSSSSASASDTALGDWYVNRISVDHCPLLILVSERSLLPILVPARNVARLPDRLTDIVSARLRRLGAAPALVDREIQAMSPVHVASTANRSVVGIMVDFAKAVPFLLERGAWDQTTLPCAEAQLGETPCHAGRRFEDVVFPNRRAMELLESVWGAG